MKFKFIVRNVSYTGSHEMMLAVLAMHHCGQSKVESIKLIRNNANVYEREQMELLHAKLLTEHIIENFYFQDSNVHKKQQPEQEVFFIGKE